MKNRFFIVFIILFALCSCATPKLEFEMEIVQEITEEVSVTNASKETEPQEKQEFIESSVKPEQIEEGIKDVSEEKTKETTLPETGSVGPNGGLVFIVNNKAYEIGNIIDEVPSYDEGKVLISEGYELPSLEELTVIYNELFETALLEMNDGYFWTKDESEDKNLAKVLYFGTGFVSEFFKDMDFVGIIEVKAL
ncbi:MAG: hypothetical protein HUK24_07650 [Sphaerochaetaceae bacterium]|nr:hypothetical protein [Sphaerochaetaceae bacterium]